MKINSKITWVNQPEAAFKLRFNQWENDLRWWMWLLNTWSLTGFFFFCSSIHFIMYRSFLWTSHFFSVVFVLYLHCWQTMLNVHDPREVAKQFNSRNAKVVAFIIVTGFIIYHGILHVTSGKFFYILLCKIIQ